ncbi:MAG: GrpB family protein [Actinomycetota bacterium]|nr:GrpB family protein [Actinomycetota bacterium]
MTSWPAWATEKVEVREPDAAWQQRGEQECQLLASTLSPWLVAPVEHVGSTAVPGLAAKPILDVQAAVDDFEATPYIAVALGVSWHFVPVDLDGRPWRRFFVKVIDGHRYAHLHVMRRDSVRWGQQLAFRDALRADSALAARYARLKRDLAARHGDDREAYTDAKHAFVQTVINNEKDGFGCADRVTIEAWRTVAVSLATCVSRARPTGPAISITSHP